MSNEDRIRWARAWADERDANPEHYDEETTARIRDLADALEELGARVPSAEAVEAVREVVKCYTREIVPGKRTPRYTLLVEEDLRANWPPAWGPWPGAEGGA